MQELQRRAALDPDTRRLIRIRRACYIAAVLFGLAPLFYAMLFISVFAIGTWVR